jgi:hypothetical protein
MALGRRPNWLWAIAGAALGMSLVRDLAQSQRGYTIAHWIVIGLLAFSALGMTITGLRGGPPSVQVAGTGRRGARRRRADHP